MGKTFRLTVNDKTYGVEIGDLSQSTIEVRVDGEMFSVRLEGDAPEVDRGPAPVMSMAANPVAPPASPVMASPKTKGPSTPPAGHTVDSCLPLDSTCAGCHVFGGGCAWRRRRPGQ